MSDRGAQNSLLICLEIENLDTGRILFQRLTKYANSSFAYSKKCASRNLACPGHGVILNWQWGVASRGKLAGKTIPAARPARTSPSQSTEDSRSPSRASKNYAGSENPKLQPPRSISTRTPAKPTSSRTQVEKRKTYANYLAYQPLADNCLTSIPSFKTGILQERTARSLFHHYGKTIAATMVWVDGPDNHWRSTMMSMALQSTPLLLSILAFAAEHLASATLSSCLALKNDLIMRAKAYGNSALSLLASDMRSTAITFKSLTSDEKIMASRHEVANAILASMLILCNMETVRPSKCLSKCSSIYAHGSSVRFSATAYTSRCRTNHCKAAEYLQYFWLVYGWHIQLPR